MVQTEPHRVAGPGARLGAVIRWLAPVARHPSAPLVLGLVIGLAGLVLRVEHALTFDGLGRGSDYQAYLRGVRWVMDHGVPFDSRAELQIRHYPPLWYLLSALMLKMGLPERALAFIAVAGWGVRHLLLARLLTEAAPRHPWSRLLALGADAFLPLGVLMSGKVNPEGLNATLFFVALYFLWRLERALHSPEGPSWRTALWFGLSAGLAILTKQTGLVLVLAGVILLAWYFVAHRRVASAKPSRRRTLQCAAIAAIAIALVSGWYFGNNLVRFGTPLAGPYIPSRLTPRIIAQNPVAFRKPVVFRRPLEWFLPFEFNYLREPMGALGYAERPNFWGTIIAGTWGDYCNRGFCRLSGGASVRRYWGGWPVSERCVSWLRHLVLLGLLISILTATATVAVAVRFLRTRGASGSLVVPLAPILVIGFAMSFATIYPFDRGEAVTKANYVLAATTPLAACCGMGLVALSSRRRLGPILHVLGALALLLVATMVIAGRVGWSP